MSALFQDLRYAARQLVGHPGFSAVVVLTVAIGMAATTTIFSLVNAILLQPLPVQDPDRLVAVAELRGSGERRSLISYPRFLEYRERGEGARLGAYGFDEVAFRADDEAGVLLAAYVTGDYFELLGVTPAHGRFFTKDEETPGVAEPVAVISHELWQRHFGGDAAAIGETLRLNGRPLTVIGVAPREFHGIDTGFALDVWVPIPMYAELNPGSDIYTPGRQSWLVMYGRLGPGVDAPAAEAALGAIARGLAERSEGRRDTAGVQVSRLSGIGPDLRTPVRLFLALLLATAGLVLVIGCVNVAGMLLARSASRGREIGIRLALGAGRRRVVAQLLTETSLLFVLGGAAGLLLAVWLVDAIMAFLLSLPGEFGLLRLDAAPDARVVGFAFLLSLATGLVFGLAPALRATRPDVQSALKEGGGATRSRSRLRGAFVVGQIALCLLLLASAGLLVRSLRSALAIDPGLDAEGVVVASLDLGPHGYDETPGRIFYEQLASRLRAQPGIESVALARQIPLSFNQLVYAVRIPGHEPPAGAESFTIEFNVVDADYFRTLRIPVEGRGFTAADGPDAPGVVVVNRTMARRFWPEGDAIGRRLSVGGEDVEVVGVVADGKYQSLTEEPIPYLYLPFAQRYGPRMTLHVRATGGLESVPELLRREVRRLDADVPLVSPTALERSLRLTILPQRIAATLIGIFGAVGLLLAAVGLYGTLAYTVRQRTREIGVRLAVGGGAHAIVRMILRQGGSLILGGLAIGLVLAFAATRLLSALLLEVSPTDPATFFAVTLLLGAVALLASYLPARRAAKVDPMVALRAE